MFKVGDKVVCIQTGGRSQNPPIKGRIYTLIEVDSSGRYVKEQIGVSGQVYAYRFEKYYPKMKSTERFIIQISVKEHEIKERG